MYSPRESDKASSSNWKGKAVDPAEHSNSGGNVDEAGKAEKKEDAAPINEENAVEPPNPATSSKAKKTFGMHKAQLTARKGNDPSNYEDRFPEDPIYEETAPNARVWMTHQAESAIHDASKVEEYRDNVDVLLVFAGLFSAVVTTFVVQTSQSLQADYAQVSASLLFELLLVQRAIANGSPVDTIPVSDSLNPQTTFVPTATDVWVNGLWFSSLFLSLTTALVAVLVKQWLHHYIVLPSGTPRDRCFVRQYRYLGFQKWRVEVIVGMLPVLMHLALVLFFIGLSLFLHPLRAALSWVVGTGTILLIVAYMIVTILPMHFPQCPYHTSLCDLAYPPYIFVVSLVQKNYNRLCQLLQQWPYHTLLFNLASSPYIHVTSLVQKHYHRLRRRWHNNLDEPDSTNDMRAKPNSLKQLELGAVEKVSLRLSVEALQWLLSASSNPAVQSIVVESIGGLPMAAQIELQDILHGSPSIVDVQRNLLLSLTGHNYNPADWLPRGMIPLGTERKFERLLCSGMFIPRVEYLWVTIDVPDQSDRDEFAATLVTQIPKLCHVEYLGLCEPGMFLHNILSLETPARFPPIIWANLVQSATASWDPDLFSIDQFPILFCSAMTESIVGVDNFSQQHLFTSPLVVEFPQAAKYFPEMALEYMMRWLLPFDLLPGERLGCRVFAASIHLMIDRLSKLAEGTDIARTLEIKILRGLLGIPWGYTPKNSEYVRKILESVILNTPIFSQSATSKYDECVSLVLECYTRFVLWHNLPSRIYASSSALQLLVTFITAQWSTLHTSTRTSEVLEFLTTCLEERFRPAYDVFHEQECLKFLAKQPVSSWSASLLKAYVMGIAAAIHPYDGDPEENQTILQAIDCLHEPENLFLVCSTLAMLRPRTFLINVAGFPNIMTALAQIRPLDPVWDTCRQRLQELAEARSFSVVTGGKEPDIEKWRLNIRKAIETLGESFSDIPPQATASLELPGPPPQPQSRLDRLLPWRRLQQQGAKKSIRDVPREATGVTLVVLVDPEKPIHLQAP
ncbi:hypothetical protein IW262DRAFT_1479730 [Armillaria fumosa]|nr:hypothetical protein IW262DRAFT_1479730 [Armillaria fumosa]